MNVSANLNLELKCENNMSLFMVGVAKKKKVLRTF
jgi:hypothetical protein